MAEAAAAGERTPTLIERLLPTGVATAERFGDSATDVLWPDEEHLVVRAVPSRRAEFTTGRACARAALAALGREPTAIGIGPNREPLWPVGTVGSITHCAGYRAAAVALTDARIRSLGIDGEPAEPLPREVVSTIVSDDETSAWEGRGVGPVWDRVVFSAKEALYKAWFPLNGSWLGFDEVRIRPGSVAGQLLVEPISAQVRRGLASVSLDAQYLVDRGLVLTTVVLT